MEREVSPTPPTVLEEKVVVAQAVASAQTVQKQLAQLVRYLHLAQEPFRIQPHHEIWAIQAWKSISEAYELCEP